MEVVWRGVVLEVRSEEDARLIEDVLEDLVLPFRLVGGRASIGELCCRDVVLSVEGLPLRLSAVVDCGTQGCHTAVAVDMAYDHPLRPHVRRAVEETWVSTVARAELWWWDGVHVRVLEFREGVELETIEAPCSGGWGGRGGSAVFQAPVASFVEALRRELRAGVRLLELLREAQRMVEEVEREVEVSELDEETRRRLVRGLRAAYPLPGLLAPEDELEAEPARRRRRAGR